MIIRWKPNFVKLHSQLHSISQAPFNSLRALLSLQEFLIVKIKYLEHKIRKAKASGNADSVSRYQYLLFAIKTFGDGIAFIYIDRWDIKMFGRNNSSGFILGKSGMKLELKILRQCSAMTPMLLADITNCLRISDLYIFKEGFPPFITEVKSSKSGKRGARALRQRKRQGNVLEYLHTDKSENAIIRDGTLVRKSLHSNLKLWVHEMNSAIEEATSSGYSITSPEDGLLYIASNKSCMEAALRKFEYLSSPVYWDLLSILPDSRDFYPLVLNIHDPNAYFDFLNGNLILIVIFDNAIIESKFVERGFACEFIQDPQSDYYLRISQENGFAPMEVSRNFVGRVAFEFLSLSWMVDELVSQYYYAMEKLKNMELCEGRVSASRTDARLN